MNFTTTSYIPMIIKLSLLFLYCCSSFKSAIIGQNVVTINICWIPFKILRFPPKHLVKIWGLFTLSHSNQTIGLPTQKLSTSFSLTLFSIPSLLGLPSHHRPPRRPIVLWQCHSSSLSLTLRRPWLLLPTPLLTTQPPWPDTPLTV